MDHATQKAFTLHPPIYIVRLDRRNNHHDAPGRKFLDESDEETSYGEPMSKIKKEIISMFGQY